MNVSQFPVTNYNPGFGGKHHCVGIAGIFGAGFVQDWRQFKVDNFPFIPQSVFIDNTAGTVPLVIVVAPLGYTITCPAGTSDQYKFPAPVDQSWNISGDPVNATAVYAVDYSGSSN